MDSTVKCPHCGGTMEFRLGEYECPQCPHTSPAQMQHGALPSAVHDVYTLPAQAERLHSHLGLPRPDIVGSARLYDPAPTLSNEKLILLGVFLFKAAVNIAAATVQPEVAADGTQATFASQFMVELISLGLIATVLYLPLIPLKWLCASYSCCMATLGMLGLLLSAVLTPLIGLLIPNGSGLGELGGWLLGAFNVLVQLWLASVLYRDIQKLQLRA